MSKQAHLASSTTTQEKQPDLHISGKREKIVLNWEWKETESGKTVALTNLSNAVNKAIAAKTIGDGLKQCFSGTGGAAAANYIAIKLMESLWSFVVVEGVNGDKLEVTVPENRKENFIAVVKRRVLVQELQKNMAMDNSNFESLLNGVPDFLKNMLAMSLESLQLNSVTFVNPVGNASSTTTREKQPGAPPNVTTDYSDGPESEIIHEGKGNKDYQIVMGQTPSNMRVSKNVATGGGKIVEGGENNQSTIVVASDGNLTADQLAAIFKN